MKENFKEYKDKNFEENTKLNYENKEFLPFKKEKSKNDYFYEIQKV